MNDASHQKSLPILPILCVALSLAIGWGIRGNFGHEYGAMIPGVLATLAAVLLTPRQDWHRQMVFFAFFGALGWSFGGSISYMQVIGYTHSGDSLSVLYGFACLFVIGFLWAAFGGAGSAMPAVLTRERLLEFFWPLIAVFAAWTVQDWVVARWFDDADFRHQSPLYWYDTDWLGVLLALAAVLLLAGIRRRFDRASSLIVHMAMGWWVGFLVLVVLLDWRMTPPRGDNWAGCVGMLLGMWIYFQRHKLTQLTFASLVTGLIGGFGFATASLLKLIGMTSGWQTNWHSLLEQSYGFINGVGLAIALFCLARRIPVSSAAASSARPPGFWIEGCAAGFVLLGVTYLNLRKNPEVWVKAKAVPEMMYGLSAVSWFDLSYVALALTFVLLLAAHRRQPLQFLSSTWLGRGQLLYLIFLWWMVVGNFLRAVVSFAPQRLVTEGIIFLNAALCTVGLLVARGDGLLRIEPKTAPVDWLRLVRKTALVGSLALALSIIADWAIIRGIYGDRQAGYSNKHIRFGAKATATKEKPSAAAPHP